MSISGLSQAVRRDRANVLLAYFSNLKDSLKVTADGNTITKDSWDTSGTGTWDRNPAGLYYKSGTIKYDCSKDNSKEHEINDELYFHYNYEWGSRFADNDGKSNDISIGNNSTYQKRKVFDYEEELKNGKKQPVPKAESNCYRLLVPEDVKIRYDRFVRWENGNRITEIVWINNHKGCYSRYNKCAGDTNSSANLNALSSFEFNTLDKLVFHDEIWTSSTSTTLRDDAFKLPEGIVEGIKDSVRADRASKLVDWRNNVSSGSYTKNDPFSSPNHSQKGLYGVSGYAFFGIGENKNDETSDLSSVSKSRISIPNNYFIKTDANTVGTFSTLDELIFNDYIWGNDTESSTLINSWYEFTFKPSTTDELKIAVDKWTKNESNAITLYGTIDTWDVSAITDMSELFKHGRPEASSTSGGNTLIATSFNSDISNWNVQNVSSMSYMFSDATSFNQNLSSWKVDKVTDMSWMFQNAEKFNQNLSSWKVDKVTDMDYMFHNAEKFNQNLSTWDLHVNIETFWMFSNSGSAYKHISSSKLIVNNKFGYIFFNKDTLTGAIDEWISNEAAATSVYGDINTWIFDSTITDMRNMFKNGRLKKGENAGGVTINTTNFNSDISGWTVSNIANMSSMFEGASSFNKDISGWDVSLVTDMSSMFEGATAFNQDISNWERGGVADSSTLKYVKDMSSMFKGASSFNSDISGWNVQNVTDMSSMFEGASSFNSDISGWNIQPVVNITYDLDVTKDCLLSTLEPEPESEHCEPEPEMEPQPEIEPEPEPHKYYALSSATSGNPFQISKTKNGEPLTGSELIDAVINIPYTTTEVMDMSQMFLNASNFISTHGKFTSKSKLQEAVNNFTNNSYTSIIKYGNIEYWDVSQITDMSELFKDKTNFNSDISGWNVQNVTDMSEMFSGATNFNMSLKNWQFKNDDVNVTSMFKDNTKIKELHNIDNSGTPSIFDNELGGADKGPGTFTIVGDLWTGNTVTAKYTTDDPDGILGL